MSDDEATSSASGSSANTRIELASELPPLTAVSRRLEGIAGSPGLAIGRAVVVDTRHAVTRRRVHADAIDLERARFESAVLKATEQLRSVIGQSESVLGRAEQSILEAYELMLEDPELAQEVFRRIEQERCCAEWAVDATVNEMRNRFKAAEDPYLSERGHDVRFVGKMLVRALSGNRSSLAPPRLEEPSILVARDLSPAETVGLDKSKVLGIVIEGGTRTSHTAILARSLEIPAVVGARGVTKQINAGDKLIVDGTRGSVDVWPTQDELTRARQRSDRMGARTGTAAPSQMPTATRCGTAYGLKANIELPGEVSIAFREGASGIGLYRTEFLYVDRMTLPTEEEQFEVYRAVAEAADQRPVTLRTFDIGGDKFVSAFEAPPEMNPALGLRAVRLGLAHPEMFSTQLRAMVRASAFGDLRIMVPMISGVQELEAVRELFDRAKRDVAASGYVQARRIQFGIMVEVPAAALVVERLAPLADFLSVGTNDLVQYCLAVDRGNRELAQLGSPFHPAILQLIRRVIDAGQRLDRPVSVCGAMASDVLGATLLLGMGVRELSMEASAISAVRQALARVTLEEAADAADRALTAPTAYAAEKILAERFAPRFSEILLDVTD